MGKRGQQEIVGFVLIVVLVIIGLMFFLLYSLKNNTNKKSDVGLEKLLTSINHYTTTCTIQNEKQTVYDLFINCLLARLDFLL